MVRIKKRREAAWRVVKRYCSSRAHPLHDGGDLRRNRYRLPNQVLLSRVVTARLFVELNRLTVKSNSASDQIFQVGTKLLLLGVVSRQLPQISQELRKFGDGSFELTDEIVASGCGIAISCASGMRKRGINVSNGAHDFVGVNHPSFTFEQSPGGEIGCQSAQE